MALPEVVKTFGVAGTAGGLVSDQIVSGIRSTVLTIGGLLVGKGYLTDDDLSFWGGIAINLLTIMYLLYRNYVAKQKIVAAVQLNTGMSEAEVTKKLNTGQIVVPPKPTKQGE